MSASVCAAGPDPNLAPELFLSWSQFNLWPLEDEGSAGNIIDEFHICQNGVACVWRRALRDQSINEHWFSQDRSVKENQYTSYILPHTRAHTQQMDDFSSATLYKHTLTQLKEADMEDDRHSARTCDKFHKVTNSRSFFPLGDAGDNLRVKNRWLQITCQSLTCRVTQWQRARLYVDACRIWERTPGNGCVHSSSSLKSPNLKRNQRECASSSGEPGNDSQALGGRGVCMYVWERERD